MADAICLDDGGYLGWTNSLGLFPLHKAIQYKLCESIILRILEAHQKAAKLPDVNGILPIQMAVESNLPDKIIIALIQANKDVFKMFKTNAMLSLLKDEAYDILDNNVNVSGNDVNALELSAFNLPQQSGNVLIHTNDTISCAETLESFSVLSMHWFVCKLSNKTSHLIPSPQFSVFVDTMKKKIDSNLDFVKVMFSLFLSYCLQSPSRGRATG